MPLALVTLFLLALALRVRGLDARVHWFVDELNFAEGVTLLEARDDYPLLARFSWVAAFPALYPYAQRLAADATGHTLAALRLPSAVLGALTVLAVYALARALKIGRGASLLAASLLATFPPHLHFSRLGLNNVADPLFGTLALAALLRARSARGAWAAGVLLGLTQYFYEGGRLLFPLVAAAAVVDMAARRISDTEAQRHGEGHRELTQRREVAPAPAPAPAPHSALRAFLSFLLSRYSFLLAAFLLTAAPVYLTWAHYGSGFAPRLANKALDADYWARLLFSTPESGWLWSHVQHVARAFTLYGGAADGSFYYGGILVLPVLLPLLLVGSVAAARRRGAWVLLMWMLLAAAGNSLLRFPDWASGFVVTFPALCVLMALGAEKLMAYSSRLTAKGLTQRHKDVKTQRVIRQAAPVIAALLCAVQVVYFAAHLDAYERAGRPGLDTHDVLFRALDYPPGTQVYVVGLVTLYAEDVVRFAGYIGRPDLTVTVLPPAPYLTDALASVPDGARLFFVVPDDAATLAALRAAYPDLRGPFASPYASVPRDKQFALYTVGLP